MTTIFCGGPNHTTVLLESLAEYGITSDDGMSVTYSSHSDTYDVLLPLPRNEYARLVIADFVTAPVSRHCDCYNNEHPSRPHDPACNRYARPCTARGAA
ncbi:hypothetical protein [Streptomyces sp. NPDC059631]|uniref:hypothetical protein n=1 Tax=unclassified Streptomyces TaxID=2593676 RepID=UPI0036C37D92